MITAAEERFILDHAYVPEHLPGYVQAISGAEPHLLGAYLCFHVEDTLMFNAYPLGSPFDRKAMLGALEAAATRFKPRTVALAAPTIPRDRVGGQAPEQDQYFRLELAQVRVDAKLRNMLRRASRELQVEWTEEIGEDHTRLILEFIRSHPLSEETRYIFEKIPGYISCVPSARVFSVRDGSGRLVAFDVAEFGAADYGFYQFNFRSRTCSVPGASDLLLQAVITTAREQGKRFLNLGLGINAGVRHFKEKWGGAPFLDYEYCRFAISPPRLLDVLLQRL
jgi:hypothetical protein